MPAITLAVSEAVCTPLLVECKFAYREYALIALLALLVIFLMYLLNTLAEKYVAVQANCAVLNRRVIVLEAIIAMGIDGRKN